MTEHYFTKTPTSKLRAYKIKVIVRNQEIELYTASGLFSAKRLDNGSGLLINKCLIKEKDKVLDLGCGYGIVGISIKLAFPKIDLTLSDINERAISLTNKNL